MHKGSRALGDIGIGIGLLAAALVISVLGDAGESLVFGFGVVGALVLMFGVVHFVISRRRGSVSNRP